MTLGAYGELRSCPKTARKLSNKCSGSRDSAEVGKMLAFLFLRSLVELGQMLAKFCQWVEFGQSWATFSQALPKLVKKVAMLGQLRSKLKTR